MLPDLAIAPVRRVLYGQEAIIYSCSVSRVEVQVFLARCTVITTICPEWLCSACLDIQLDSPLLWLAPAPRDREPLQNSPRSSFLEVPALSGRDLVAPTCARVEARWQNSVPNLQIGQGWITDSINGFFVFHNSEIVRACSPPYARLPCCPTQVLNNTTRSVEEIDTIATPAVCLINFHHSDYRQTYV